MQQDICPQEIAKEFNSMTRINVGVHPKYLSKEHLIAEHREIKRIPNVVRSGKAVLKDIPESFTLGKGHVKFFYNKLGFLLKRYRQIYKECIKRGYKVQDYSGAWDGIKPELMQDYRPSKNDKILILNRISERTNSKKAVTKK